MIGQTNSLIGGAETLVFAEPLQSQTLHKDDKVFIIKPDIIASSVYSATVTGAMATANTYVAPFFLNDGVAVCPAPASDKSLHYLKYTTGWEVIPGAFQADFLGYTTFRSLARGDFLVFNGKHCLLYNEHRADDISYNGIYYAGKFGDNDYAVSSADGSVYLYDWSIKSAGDLVFKQYLNYVMHGADEASQLLFVQDDNKQFCLFRFADNAFSELGSSYLNGYVVGYTGLDAGDYLFVIETYQFGANPHYWSSSENYLAGTGDCCLTVYVSDGEGGVTAIDSSSPLYRFMQDNAIAHFDSRTHLLFIGTISEIHFFYWDETDKSWTEILIDGLVLPANPDGNHIYNAAISPQFQSLLVYCGNSGNGNRNVKIYNLDFVSAEHWRVADSADFGKYPSLVWSAMATGNTDTEGRAELKVTMPSKINVEVDIDPTPDNFNFSGDE